MFWAILTTIAFALAAIAMLINRQARLAMRLMTLMLALFGVMVWIPRLIAHQEAHGNWSEFRPDFPYYRGYLDSVRFEVFLIRRCLRAASSGNPSAVSGSLRVWSANLTLGLLPAFASSRRNSERRYSEMEATVVWASVCYVFKDDKFFRCHPRNSPSSRKNTFQAGSVPRSKWFRLARGTNFAPAMLAATKRPSSKGTAAS